MWSSPFFSRTGIVSFLSLITLTTATGSIGGGTFFNGSGAPGAAPYQLVDEYLPSNFFDNFNFFSDRGDPTNGHVQYVNRSVAQRNGYTATVDGSARMSVDTTNKWPLGGLGRPAVRVYSNNSYTHGLFIADIKHMPSGCGTWPAYWLLGPDPWPTYGEIDIVEGVHDSIENGVSLHTTDGCMIAGSDQSATLQTTNCYFQANFNSGCGSKLNATNIPNNYGKPFNDNGGGVYVTEWTTNYVKHWFFPRGSIPPSIASGTPDVSSFGKPTVNQQGPGCTIDEHFGNMNIIINTDFCGDWAGEVYNQFPNCPMNTAIAKPRDRCVDYVGQNPAAFMEAYWDFNSIRVYQMPVGAQATSSYSTSLSSTQPLPSTNTIDAGMGRTSSSVSSIPYIGPLSSLTSTSSLSATESSTSTTPELPDESGFFSSYYSTTSTPVFSSPPSTSTSAAPSGPACPGKDQQLITAPGGRVFRLYCSSDTQGTGLGEGAFDVRDLQAPADYDACFNYCTAEASCTAFIWRVGSKELGGGTCYSKRLTQVPKPSTDSNLWALILVSGDGSGTPSSASATPSSTSSTAGPASTTSASGSVSVPVIDTPTTSSTQSVPTAVPCPYANGTEYVSSSGKVYEIFCYMDESSNAPSSTYVSGDYALCVDECEKSTGCVSITYSAFGGGGTGGLCYFRTSIGSLSPSDNSDVHLNLIPGKSSSIAPTTTTTTTTSSPSSSSPAVASLSTDTASSGSQTTSSASSSSTDEDDGGSSMTMSDGDDDGPTSTMSDDDSMTTTSIDDGELPTDLPTTTLIDDGDLPTSTSIDDGDLPTDLPTSTSEPDDETPSSSSVSASTTSSPSSVSVSTSLSSSSSTDSPSSTRSASSSTSASNTSSITTSPSSTSSTSSGMSPTTSLTSNVPSTRLSSSTISFVTSASASPMPSGSNPACDSVFKDPTGESYLVKCSTDSSSDSFRTVPVRSGGFGSCFGACDTTQNCVGFTYVGTDIGNCYLKATPGTFKAAGDTFYSAFKLSALGYSSTSSISSTSLSVSVSGSSVSSSASVSGFSASSSTSSRATTSFTATSRGLSSSTSSSRSSSVSYAPPPACPTSSSYYCMESNQQTTCSSGNNNYAIQCGILYEGTEIDTSDINELSGASASTAADDQSGTSGMSGADDASSTDMASDMDMTMLAKRAIVADATACRNLCDRTSGCKAFNFVGNNCTLFSTVTGYSYAPGALGGTVYTQGEAPPTPVDTSPACPGSAGKSFDDSMGTRYNIVCYTQYGTGYTDDAPFYSDNLANCLPTCGRNALCAGVVFNTATRLCQLLFNTAGPQIANNNYIAALRVGGPPAYQSPTSVPTTTVTTTLLPTSTLSLSSGATITLPPSQPVDTVTSTVDVTAPTGGSFTSVSSGSFYVYPSSSVTSPPVSGGGGTSICFTCDLTPVIITPGGDIPTGPPVLTTTPGNYNPTCAARPPLTGTTTIYTTHTITACGPQPTCPASGYFIYTGTSRPGQEVVTTTNSRGSSYVFTQVPATTTPSTTSGGGGSGTGSGTGGGGGGGPTVTVPGGPTNPTCPASNGQIYTGSMGLQYEILCNTRFTDTTLETQTQDRLDACIAACDMYNTLTFYLGSQCLGVNYYGAKAVDNCELKAGSNGVNDVGITACRLVTPRPGGNGTGPNTNPGDYGSTIIGPGPTQTANGTLTETTTSISVSLVPSTIYSVSTVVSTYISNGVPYITSYGVSSAVSVSFVPASTRTVTTTTTSLVPSTIYQVSTAVSTYVSNGVSYVTSYGVSTAVSVSLIPASTRTVTTTTTSLVPSTIYQVSTVVSTYMSFGFSFVTSHGVTTAVSISLVPAPTQTVTTTSYVPSTIYEIRTTVSTYVSNGISYVTSYGVSTAVSISYIPATASTNTVTTTMISISVSERTVPGTGPGEYGGTGGGSGGTVTVTATPTNANTYGPGGSGGGVVTLTTGGGGYITVTEGSGGMGGATETSTTTVYVTRTVAPSSRSASSSTFTCRTYATNYLNAAVPTGVIKRSIFEAELVIAENEKAPRPGGMPQLWYHGLDEVVADYLE